MGQTPGKVKVGSETPKKTPSFSVRGNSQSGSPERDAKCDTKSRRKGCPGHRSWRCLGPRIARSSSRSASWKGCVVAPDARDIRTLSIQGRVRVMIRAPKVANGEILRKGGLSLPEKVSPPIPQRAEVWDPESGQAFGAVQDLVPLSLLPQLFRISGHRGHGRWEVWVHCSTRAYGVCLRVELPVQAGLRGVLASGLFAECPTPAP